MIANKNKMRQTPMPQIVCGFPYKNYRQNANKLSSFKLVLWRKACANIETQYKTCIYTRQEYHDRK